MNFFLKFHPINHKYKYYLNKLLEELKKNPTIDIFYEYEIKKYSYLLSKELKIFLKEIETGNDFFLSLSKSFKDPILKKITLTKDILLISNYIEKKYLFWKNFLKRNLYAYILYFFVNCLGFFFKNLFFIKKYYFYIFIEFFIFLFIHIFFYILIIKYISYTYNKFINQYMYVKYLSYNCSLEDLLKIDKYHIFKEINTNSNYLSIEYENNKFLDKNLYIISIIFWIFNITLLLVSIFFCLFLVLSIFNLFLINFKSYF